jgi:hypothetical protein
VRRVLQACVVAAACAVIAAGAAGLGSAAGEHRTGHVCTPAQLQYGCGPDCPSFAFAHPFHGDPAGPGPDQTAVWETETLSFRLDFCTGVGTVKAKVTWFRDTTRIAEGLSYAVTAADVGSILSARIRVRDDTGVRVFTRSMGEPAAYHAPVQDSAPVISGTLKVGETLTGSPGSWHLVGAAPGPPVFSYFWIHGSDGVPASVCTPELFGVHVSGSEPTFTLTPEDAGNLITLVVLGSNSPGGPLPPSIADCVLTTTSTVTVAP